MTIAARDVVSKFAPNAKAEYRQAFDQGDALLAENGIVTPLRLAHFMAQSLHETGALTLLVESGRYRSNGLASLWDGGNWHKYFANRDACLAMADQCAVDGGKALFSLVYSGRMGNGPPETNDGWTYRGRGLIQTTGRESYRRFGLRCGVPFEQQPDLVVSAEHALKPALAEWSDKKANDLADRNDIKAVTRAINGGIVGLKERTAWFAKIWPFIVGPPPTLHNREWRVQSALVQLGYDSGNPDGQIGPTSRKAILAYRAANKLGTSPAITPDLLASLGID
jgi:putative chitinase